MSDMRRRLELQAICFKHVVYEFASTGYYNALIDFLLDTTYSYWHSTEELGDTTSITTIKMRNDKYIYPMPLKAISVLDGTVRGRVKYGVKAESGGNATITEFIVILKKISSTGHETYLTHHKFTVNVSTTSTGYIPYSFPFFFHIDKEKLLGTERLIVEIEIWGKTSVAGKKAYFRRYYTMNSSDQLVNIPMV